MANTSVAHVVSRSGVSRRTFYEIFSDCEDCFLAALDHALACASDYVIPVYETGGSWRERVRAGLNGLLVFLEEQPRKGRLLIVDSLAGGSRAMERRRRAIDRLIAVVDEGRLAPKARSTLPTLTAESVVGAVLSVIHARIVDADRAPLTSLLEPLTSTIMLPYLGPAAAEREAVRPAPVLPLRASPPPSVNDSCAT